MTDRGEIVLSDTVGFITRLPHDLVAAFRATLEATAEADLLLHVIDSASPGRERQIEAVETRCWARSAPMRFRSFVSTTSSI